MIYHVVEWVHYIILTSIQPRFILSLTCKLVIVISTIVWWILLLQLILIYCSFDVIIILRSIKPATALLSCLLCGGRYLILHTNWLILSHTFNVFSYDIIFAHHWLLLRMWCTLLTWESSTLATETIILLPTLWMILIHVTVEGIMMRTNTKHVVLSRHGIFIKTLFRFGSHTLIITWLWHYFLFIHFYIVLPWKVVFHALMHIINEDSILLLYWALFLRTLACCQIIWKARVCILFSQWAHGIVILRVQSASNTWILCIISRVTIIIACLTHDISLKLSLISVLRTLFYHILLLVHLVSIHIWILVWIHLLLIWLCFRKHIMASYNRSNTLILWTFWTYWKPVTLFLLFFHLSI